MINLDYSDHRPLYEQIKAKLKKLIISGAMVENEQLPSVRELAQILSINPNTIQRAYKDLEMDGFVYSVRAKGSFVAPLKNSIDKNYCDELMKTLNKALKEIKFIGIEKSEVLDLINKIYDKGDNIND